MNEDYVELKKTLKITTLLIFWPNFIQQTQQKCHPRYLNIFSYVHFFLVLYTL